MAAPVAAPAAGVYIAGAALLAGAAYLMTPAGQRTTASLGEAVADGAGSAIDSIVNLFSGKKTEEQSESVPVAGTTTTTRPCDGPHGGRIQVQGYVPRIDPHPLELSWPWNRECVPPLRPEGLSAVSGVLLPQVAAISYESAGYRGQAFSKMSKHIRDSPSEGFLAGHRVGWGIHPATRQAVRNLRAGPDAPRVDLEVHRGRAFGVR
jgi:hypothetical protein